MRPLTYRIPKPIIPLLNQPMVMHIIDRLPEVVDRVVLAVNYKKEMLDNYFMRHEDEIRPEVVLVEEKEPLGTGGAIKNCEKVLSGTFLVFNGDVINSMNPQRIIDYHHSRKGIGTLAVWEVKDPTRYGIIGFDNAGRITRFLEKPGPEEVFSHHINAGAYVLEPEILDHIESGRMVSIEREVYPYVLDKGLYAFPFGGYWVDAGTREDFLGATEKIMGFKSMKNEIGEGCIIHPEAKLLPPVLMGNNCRISNCVVGPNVVIGDNTRIEKDARITNSTLFNDIVVSRGAVIQNSILGANMGIKEKEIVEDKIIVSPEPFLSQA